jgi:methyl-accepting chemotaxis protein
MANRAGTRARKRRRRSAGAARLEAVERAMMVAELGLDGRVQRANERFASALGYRPAELEGRRHRSLVERGAAATAEHAALWRQLGEGRPQAGLFKRLARSGRTVWLQASYSPVLDARGRPVKVVLVATEITSLMTRHAEQAAELECVRAAMLVAEHGLDGTLLRANRLYLGALGYRPDEVRGRNHRAFVGPSHAASAAYEDFWRALGEGRPLRGEYLRLGKGGREVWLLASYHPILGSDGRPVKVLELATDITEARRAAASTSALATVHRLDRGEICAAEVPLEECA